MFLHIEGLDLHKGSLMWTMNTYTENKSWINDYLCILLDTSKAHIERGITKSYIWKELQNHDLLKTSSNGFCKAKKVSKQNCKTSCMVHHIQQLPYCYWHYFSFNLLSHTETGSMSGKHTEVNLNSLKKFSDGLICIKKASPTKKGSQN